MKKDLKLLFSFFLGISGIILLTCNLIIIIFPSVAEPSNFGEVISKNIHKLELAFLAFYSFILFLPLSFFGIFLATKSSQKKIAILAIGLNSINLLLSLFIAWLLFGLARGM